MKSDLIENLPRTLHHLMPKGSRYYILGPSEVSEVYAMGRFMADRLGSTFQAVLPGTIVEGTETPSIPNYFVAFWG